MDSTDVADEWWEGLPPERRAQIHRWIDGRSSRTIPEIPGQLDMLDAIHELEEETDHRERVSASLPCAALPAADVETIWVKPCRLHGTERPTWVPLIASGWALNDGRLGIWAIIEWDDSAEMVGLLPAGRVIVAAPADADLTTPEESGESMTAWLLPPVVGPAEHGMPHGRRFDRKCLEYWGMRDAHLVDADPPRGLL